MIWYSSIKPKEGFNMMLTHIQPRSPFEQEPTIGTNKRKKRKRKIKEILKEKLRVIPTP